MMSSYTSTSKRRFFHFLFTVALVAILALPIFYFWGVYDDSFRKLVQDAQHNEAKIVLFGNSINIETSSCDSDKSNLPTMLQTASGIEVNDISKGGMSSSEFYSLAKLLPPAASQRIVVMPIGEYASETFSVSDSFKRNQIAVRELFVSLITNTKSYLLPTLTGAFRQPESYEYQGVNYGSYADFKLSHMAVEKAQMRCPEPNGFDPHFVEFMHWKAYGLPVAIDTQGLSSLDSLHTYLEQRGTKLITFLVPANIELMRTLENDTIAKVFEDNVTKIKDALDTTKVPYLDLSQALPNKAFSDRYCACGHLNDEGRARVAEEISNWIERLALQ